MKKLKIIWMQDCTHCETCGYSFAEGFKTYLDGELIDEFVPHAACYDGDSISEEETYIRLFKKLGFELEWENG